MSAPLVSVIVRTKNEENWIQHCLKSIKTQSYAGGIEIIVVDNLSTDMTLGICAEFPEVKVVTIEKYLPGDSLNTGISAANGEILVLLSAHCIPTDELHIQNLVRNFDDPSVAGVYGRQLPLTYSDDGDIRDLLITFGQDRRVQVKDCFFHNANSAIRRDIWEKIPFDPSVTNIEDRIWAGEVIKAGYKLIYEPEAAVFHYHGIHQTQSPTRAASTVKVLRAMDEVQDDSWFPAALQPENRTIVGLLPLQKTSFLDEDSISRLEKLIETILHADGIKHLFLLKETDVEVKIKLPKQVIILDRPEHLSDLDVSFVEVLQWALCEIEQQSIFPEYLIFATNDYVFRPEGIFGTLVEQACYNGYDSLFFAYADYSNLWRFNEAKNTYEQLDANFSPRHMKNPFVKPLYGQGCILRPEAIRSGVLIGERNVGILETSDVRHIIRTQNIGNGISQQLVAEPQPK